MRPDWLVPLLILLLALVPFALWLRLRARRRAVQSDAALANSAEPAGPPAGEAEPAQAPPPETQPGREELARLHPEQEAAASQSAEAPPKAGTRAEGASQAEATAGGPLAETAAEVPPEDAAEATLPKAAPDPEDDGTPAGKEEAPPSSPPDPVLPDTRETPSETPLVSAISPADAPVAADDAYDSEGRVILPIGMGDVIVTTEMPRHIRLAVTRQWPLPVVRGFKPEAERLVLFYDGLEATDVVMLPTVDETWQISLGGRPVVQVECADGPEALGRALRVNPDESEAC